MATETTVNGNYGAQQSYDHAESYAGTAGSQNGQGSSSPSRSAGATASLEEKPPTKEEIGWFFVEQYYKTLCNEPAKLFLYYSKRSQFVSGDEAEKVQVAVGQKAIADRIKQLDIQDCKVRVLNVDSQESLKNILVQVIGEMSNKAEPHRKFVQTFVLAEQTSGYYVLNDVFRYIVLDEEELENGNGDIEQLEPSATTQKSSNETADEDPVIESQKDLQRVDEKLEQATSSEATQVNGHVKDEVEEKAAAVSSSDAAPAPNVSDLANDTPTADAGAALAEPEKPKDPAPSPTRAAAKPAPAPEPAKPAAPKTWANLVAANRVAAAPAAAASAPASSNGAAAGKPKLANASKESAPAATSAPAADDSAKAQQNGNTGWQMAGASSEKRQNRQHSQSVSGNGESVLGYVKNVTDKVDASILKEKLNQLGKLVYFDVSRQKNCAFVEFADVAAYNAVIAANPLVIGGEQVVVEERRPRANAFGGNFANRGGVRGGRGGADNRPPNQGRGGFNKDGGRGGYANRAGRGGPMPSRGRGQSQAA